MLTITKNVYSAYEGFEKGGLYVKKIGSRIYSLFYAPDDVAEGISDFTLVDLLQVLYDPIWTLGKSDFKPRSQNRILGETEFYEASDNDLSWLLGKWFNSEISLEAWLKKIAKTKDLLPRERKRITRCAEEHQTRERSS